jgi:tritrans,polycis-undecaprenyl-diphosphate synthase [geranylgeranyl-diphosphate specific]
MLNARYHVGLIPDGNRRWAKERGLQPWEGHSRGGEKIELFLEWTSEHKDIAEVSIYLLSEENFKRPVEELQKLYDLYEDELTKLIKREKIHRDRVRINVVSTDIKAIPRNLVNLFKRLRNETEGYGNKVLNLLVGYTGQSEILKSVSSPLNRLKNLLFGLSELDLKRGLGVRTPCDLVIRTGEESEEREARSGFLLWQSAYSEYYHINKFFPDVTLQDFNAAWDFFKNARRRKGL